ncbi:nitrogenase stabilizing/protective protein NifW [Rhodobacter ferrooxidans]|uniref:Nitrogenase-stabilizing/protective protein NifW n=1 Tax=Rhodobacter ferrooxidans TaxID=371731 RepID=C8S0S1_9RHOB|nr:nitrogenase stabilizing/protective protein NifW [Rhodobacter sp. SW2]EEW25362.1 nitrogen fixation protein NifW [Rhodobacter sp. SW2]
MTRVIQKPIATPRASVLAQIQALPSTEAIFEFLDVPYNPEVVNVARLHILKRMGVYLQPASLSGQSDATILAAAKDALRRAHADFETSTPLQEKVFKVLANANAKRSPRLVPLSAIRPATLK